MNTIAIDTHKTIMKLVEKGYTQQQAEGFVDALTESELVTKSYLDTRLIELESRITARLYQSLLIHGFATIAAILAAAGVL